jgi:DEAD/DEAH box helicase domain-containing protein
LGVDIGTLDAVIILGFPFGVASLVCLFQLETYVIAHASSQRQQMGRAGRRARDALTVLVADDRPIDQYYAEHPDELFSQVRGLSKPRRRTKTEFQSIERWRTSH